MQPKSGFWQPGPRADGRMTGCLVRQRRCAYYPPTGLPISRAARSMDGPALAHSSAAGEEWSHCQARSHDQPSGKHAAFDYSVRVLWLVDKR